MTVLQRIQREPTLLTGVVTAAVGLAILLGLDPKVAGGITLLIGALITLVLRAFVTPSSEVVVQEKADGAIVAGSASEHMTGRPVSIAVEVDPPAHMMSGIPGVDYPLGLTDAEVKLAEQQRRRYDSDHPAPEQRGEALEPGA